MLCASRNPIDFNLPVLISAAGIKSIELDQLRLPYEGWTLRADGPCPALAPAIVSPRKNRVPSSILEQERLDANA